MSDQRVPLDSATPADIAAERQRLATAAVVAAAELEVFDYFLELAADDATVAVVDHEGRVAFRAEVQR